jgi:hypothetical protein
MRSLVVIAGLLSGCGGASEGYTAPTTTGETTPPCAGVPIEVSLEESTDAGYSGAQLVAEALGRRLLLLEWASGETTLVDIEVVDPAPVALLYEAEPGCTDSAFLTVDAVLELRSDDAALQESVPVVLLPRPGIDELLLSVVVDELDGDLDVGAAVGAAQTSPPVVISLVLKPDEACGSLLAEGTGESDTVHELGWFWTESTGSDAGSGHDAFTDCFRGR